MPEEGATTSTDVCQALAKAAIRNGRKKDKHNASSNLPSLVWKSLKQQLEVVGERHKYDKSNSVSVLHFCFISLASLL